MLRLLDPCFGIVHRAYRLDPSVPSDHNFPNVVVPLHACGTAVPPGSASDYGVQKALSETTLSMLQAHGATKAVAEKENTKVRHVFSQLLT